MKKLIERIKPQYLVMISSGKNEFPAMYNSVMMKLNEYENEGLLTLSDICTITHFTHPRKSANLADVFNIFEDMIFD